MKKRHWIELVIFLTYAVFAVSWVAGSMMTPNIMSYFNVQGVAAATWTTNAITIAKVIGNLLAAYVLVALKPKKAFAFASLLIVLGVSGAFASSYPLYVFARLVLGFGGAFVIVYFNPIVLNYFSPPERPTVNGLNSIAFNTGNLVALLLTGHLLSSLGSWQNVTIAISVVSLVVLVAWWLISDDFPLSKPASGGVGDEAPYTMSQGFKDPVNWFLPFGYSGLLFCYIAVFSLFPLIPGFAVPGKNLSALMIIAGMVGTVGGIILTKKYPLRIPVMRYCGLLMSVSAAVMIWTTHVAIAYVAAFALGFLMFLPITAMMTLPQELPGMTPGRITVVFSMFWSLSYIIETAMLYCAGLIADSTGNMFNAAIFAVICSVTYFIATFFLPETGKKKTAQQ